MRNKLSVCLIVKNEEANIGRCLDSIKDIADEIVVADTGSDDSTEKILRDRGIIPYEFKWNRDFSEARNFVIEKATGDFILSLDADEVPVNPSAIVEKINRVPEDVGGIVVEIASPSDSAKTNRIFFGKNVRIFRNRPEIRFSGKIHEQIAPSIKNAGFRILPSKILINHHGYLDADLLARKHKRNLDILLQLNKEEPDNPNYYYYAGKSLMALKRHDNAAQMFARALKLLPKDDLSRTPVLNAASNNYYALEQFEDAFQTAHESLKIRPNQNFALLLLGESRYRLGDFEDARAIFKKLIAVSSDNVNAGSVFGDFLIPPEEIYFRAGKAALKAGRFEEASSDFKNGLKINPGDINCLTGMANVFFKNRNYAGARETLAKAMKIDPENKQLEKYYQAVSRRNTPVNLDEKKNSVSLSVCMIVKNEEKNLPVCLESVKDIADEIIIVDTGSADGTKKVAESYGAKIYDFEWIDDFAAARNTSLMHASKDWILYIDADETLDFESSKELKNVLRVLGEDIGAVNCIIEGEQTDTDGSIDTHSGIYPRVFRNYGYPAIKFTGKVHEQITPALKELKKDSASSSIKILHSGYYLSPEELMKKVKRNYELLMNQIKDEPENAYCWHQLGQTLGQMKLNEEAENAFLFAESIGTLSESLNSVNNAMLSHYAGKRGDYNAALNYADKALDYARDFLYARSLKAFALLHLGLFDKAEGEFIEALKLTDKRTGISSAGFDIAIPRKKILAGYEMARSRQTPEKSN